MLIFLTHYNYCRHQLFLCTSPKIWSIVFAQEILACRERPGFHPSLLVTQSLKNHKIPGFACPISKLCEALGFGLDVAPVSMLAVEVFQENLLFVPAFFSK